MTAFVLIALIATAGVSALVSLSDSALRGVRSFKRIAGQRKAGHEQRMATITIVGDVALSGTRRSNLQPIVGQAIILKRPEGLKAANSAQWQCAAA